MQPDLERGHSLDELIQSLYETILWCTSRPQPWNPKLTFRSLNVDVSTVREIRKLHVSAVMVARHRALVAAGYTPPETPLKNEGRLLLYFPDDTLDMGLEEDESKGFVTTCNVPPWDTWVAFIQEAPNTRYLVCWVPKEMEPLVEAGLAVSCERSFDWIEKKSSSLAVTLQSCGVIINIGSTRFA